MKWKGKADSRGISKAVNLAEKEAERYGVEEEQRIRFSLSIGLCVTRPSQHEHH